MKGAVPSLSGCLSLLLRVALAWTCYVAGVHPRLLGGRVGRETIHECRRAKCLGPRLAELKDAELFAGRC